MKTFSTFSMLCIAVVVMSAFGSSPPRNIVKRAFKLTDRNNASITVPMEIRDDDLFFKVHVAVDPSMEKYFKRANIDMELGMGILFNYVSEHFRRAPLHPRVNLAVSKIYVLNETWDGDYGQIYTNAKEWSYNRAEHPSSDTLLYLTNNRLCRNGDCFRGGAWHTENGPSLILLHYYFQDTVYLIALVSTHELAHTLGIPDDTEKNHICPRSLDKDTTYLMQDAGYAHEFSPCDVKHFQAWISNRIHRARLESFPSPKEYTILNNPEQWLMANQLTGDEQCRLLHGSNARVGKREHACSWQMCIVDGKVKEGDHRHADFSSCGEDKVCYRSKCLDKASIVPVDGQWSAWSPVTECSKKCGGGIQAAYRTCTNPRPRFGGYHCEGSDLWNDKPCNTHTCSSEDEK